MSGSWDEWANNVNLRHPGTLFAGVYGAAGDLYGSAGNKDLQGSNAKQEVAYLFSLPPDSASGEVYANGIHFGGRKFMYSRSIPPVKDSEPSYLHFFVLKTPQEQKVSDDDKHILCVLKCTNDCGIIALSKGGETNRNIASAVLAVGDCLFDMYNPS